MVMINIMSREEFQRLLPRDATRPVGEAIEWFSDREQTVLGAVGFSEKDGWCFAILRPDITGGYRVCERQGNFPTPPTARHALLRLMAGGEGEESKRFAA